MLYDHLLDDIPTCLCLSHWTVHLVQFLWSILLHVPKHVIVYTILHLHPCSTHHLQLLLVWDGSTVASDFDWGSQWADHSGWTFHVIGQLDWGVYLLWLTSRQLFCIEEYFRIIAEIWNRRTLKRVRISFTVVLLQSDLENCVVLQFLSSGLDRLQTLWHLLYTIHGDVISLSDILIFVSGCVLLLPGQFVEIQLSGIFH